MDTIGLLMSEIVQFDCDPSVFTVNLMKSDHRSGFDAIVEFRSTRNDSLRSISAHNDDPEIALDTVLHQLQNKWGVCPHCGNYRTEKFQV